MQLLLFFVRYFFSIFIGLKRFSVYVCTRPAAEEAGCHLSPCITFLLLVAAIMSRIVLCVAAVNCPPSSSRRVAPWVTFRYKCLLLAWRHLYRTLFVFAQKSKSLQSDLRQSHPHICQKAFRDVSKYILNIHTTL